VKVLFWGTPEFAVPPLRALLGEGFDVVGVVTQPDRAVGRSRSTLEPPPVKKVALTEGIPVLQPERPRGEEFIAQLRALLPDLSVVVAYGHILSSEIIDLPRLGTINIHASLLPKLRGAGPIQASILQGDAETGVTIMRMVRALDAGASILQVRTPIPEDETYGELQLRLSEMGAMALIEALALIDLGQAVETPQDDALATYAPKVDRTMTRVNWASDSRSVCRTIRAFDPKPGAHAESTRGEVKLFGARVSAQPVETGTTPGEVIAIDGDGMVVACQGGAVQIASVHPAGKRRIAPAEWARGRGIAVGERLS
jgi:methionyl-tRNA formyltransferase